MKNFSSFKKILLSLLTIPFLLFSSGCVYLIVGGIGVAGGYFVSPDTVEGITEADEITVWDSAIEIISVMGIIEQQNEDAGTIAAKVNGSRVTIVITAMNDAAVKLSVKARRFYMPKMSVAQDVFVKIMSSLE